MTLVRRCSLFLLFILLPILLSAQEEATVSQTEYEVKAGETFRFTVTLDRAPNFSDAAIYYQFTPPTGQGSSLGTCSTTIPGQRVYQCEFTIPLSAPGGAWTIDNVQLRTTGRQVILYQRPIKFHVVPNESITVAATAEVMVNPSQAQLLRTAAAQVQRRLESLKSGVAVQSARPNPSVTPILLENAQDALKEVDNTRANFRKAASSDKQLPVSDIFFGDLRISYEEALASIRQEKSYFSSIAGVRTVGMSESAQPRYPPIAEVIFRAFEQNILAYRLAADSNSLVFNLEVQSNPQGATVFYYRRGDAPKQLSNVTNSIIYSLPIATWLITFQKAGYKDETREHDAAREPNHVLYVEMSR